MTKLLKHRTGDFVVDLFAEEDLSGAPILPTF